MGKKRSKKLPNYYESNIIRYSANIPLSTKM